MVLVNRCGWGGGTLSSIITTITDSLLMNISDELLYHKCKTAKNLMPPVT